MSRIACSQCGALHANQCQCGWAGNPTATGDRRIRELEAELERLRDQIRTMPGIDSAARKKLLAQTEGE